MAKECIWKQHTRHLEHEDETMSYHNLFLPLRFVLQVFNKAHYFIKNIVLLFSLLDFRRNKDNKNKDQKVKKN